MKFSEIKGQKAIEVLGDLLEPSIEIMSDERVSKAFKDEKPILETAKIILKEHSESVVEILAALDGVPVEKYECNILSLPSKLLEILNDEALISFFQSQVQTGAVKSSTPVSKNTKKK